MSDTTIIKGLDQLQLALDTLPGKVQFNIMRGAVRAGAKVVQQRAISIAPEEDASTTNAYKASLGWSPGALKRSIKYSARISGQNVIGKVKAGDKIAFYAHMVEFGTAAHVIRAKPGSVLAFGGGVTSVNHPGSRRNPFMRIAMDSTPADALRAVGEYARGRLTKEGLEVPAPEDV
jgi:HK97 gp10 family phage protein